MRSHIALALLQSCNVLFEFIYSREVQWCGTLQRLDAMIYLLAALIYAVPLVQSQLCKLKAPMNASNGVWPGSNIVLNCTLLDGPVDRISWKKDGHILKNAQIVSSPKIASPDGRQVFTWEGLQLNNISNKDDGQYSCEVNKAGRSNEDLLTLHIYSKPIIITPVLSQIFIEKGESFVSTCTAKGWPKPTLHWRKRGNASNLLTKVFVTDFGVLLHISMARDEGSYICYANNTIGSDTRAVMLRFKKKDQRVEKVITSYDHVIAYVGQNLKLTCKGIDAYDVFVVFAWKHNGKRLTVKKDSHRYINHKEVEFWYSLSSLTLENSGNYTCEMQSDKGLAKQVINLRVEKNGPPNVITKAPDIYTDYGWPATLTCSFRYVDPARATLSWFKDNNKTNTLTSGRHHKIHVTMTNRGTVEYTLVFANVTKHDTGCYGCHVNTSYGRNSTKVCLHHSDSSKDYLSKMASFAPSSTTVSSWQTTLPVFLVCIVVSMAGFIVGLLVRRSKSKSTGYWVSSSAENCDQFQYDVFITFSSKDFHWVQSELIPLIEKHNLNYCIHHRDFEPGKTIVDNMAESVYKSRHILAVVSKNYMSSTFCRGELDMALGRNTQMKDSSLIAIRVDEIDKKRLPKALRNQMFLDFFEREEKDIWESLLTRELVKNTNCD